MVGTKNNRRTKYTIQLLKEALLTILTREPLAKVTITEICKEANVNRGTFYLHFESPNDLFEAIEKDISNQVRPLLKVRPKDDLYEWGRRLVSVVEDNQIAMKIILGAKREDRVIQQIFDEAHELFLKNFAEQFDVTNRTIQEYYFTFFVNGSVGIFEKWLERKDKITADEIARIIINPNLPQPRA